METIRNYLKAMFAGLPDTPEVRKAYEELAAMMEDKYTELIDEGKSENEAVGTVISEFGNRDELAQSLGIEEYINSKAAAEQSQTVRKSPMSAANRTQRRMRSRHPETPISHMAQAPGRAAAPIAGPSRTRRSCHPTM